MTKEKPLWALLNQLNTEYNLSDEFKKKVLHLVARLEGFDLQQEHLEPLALKLRETCERQVLVESCRKESQKSVEKLQGRIMAYLTALDHINQKLSQAETALGLLLSTRSTGLVALEDKKETLVSKEKAKALAAFANINSKNSRVQ